MLCGLLVKFPPNPGITLCLVRLTALGLAVWASDSPSVGILARPHWKSCFCSFPKSYFLSPHFFWDFFVLFELMGWGDVSRLQLRRLTVSGWIWRHGENVFQVLEAPSWRTWRQMFYITWWRENKRTAMTQEMSMGQGMKENVELTLLGRLLCAHIHRCLC